MSPFNLHHSAANICCPQLGAESSRPVARTMIDARKQEWEAQQRAIAASLFPAKNDPADPILLPLHWFWERAMLEANPPIRIVLTTTANPDEAAHLARTLVEEGLAACVTSIPAVQSIYRWQGKIESSTETLLLLKTGPDRLPALEARLHQLHSYHTPEFLVLDVESASHPYLEWLQNSLRPA